MVVVDIDPAGVGGMGQSRDGEGKQEVKVALVTTCVKVPQVLRLLRKHDSATRFFIAGDLQAPHGDMLDFVEKLGNVSYLSPAQQGCWKSSEPVSWNSDSRRNFAVLAALEWGADLIISTDDDMIPVSSNYFNAFRRIFAGVFNGLKIGSPGSWVDTGGFTLPSARARGFPPDGVADNCVDFVVDATIGAAQGIILGVPDTDAMTAMTNAPKIFGTDDILQAGFVVDLSAYTVFNSQITAFRRELAPCFAQFYKWLGRNTDIIASLLMRRVMKERNLFTFFGPPVGYHARRQRPLFDDLKAELWGLEHILEIADFLEHMPKLDVPENEQVMAMCRYYWTACESFSAETKDAGLAWLEDVKEALK